MEDLKNINEGIIRAARVYSDANNLSQLIHWPSDILLGFLGMSNLFSLPCGISIKQRDLPQRSEISTDGVLLE